MKLPMWRRWQREELDEEIRSHIAMAVRERVERGENPAEAEVRVRREFGNEVQVKEVTHDMWGWTWVERLWQDLRYGARMLAKSPGFTVIAVVTLALGIGANTSIFSIINAALLRNLPVPNPQELVVVGDPSRVHSLSTGSPQTSIFSTDLYRELQRNQDVFTGLAATSDLSGAPTVTIDNGAPERIYGRLVSGNYFSVLGVNAVQGSVFTGEDDNEHGAKPVVVISYKYWKRRFHQDANVIGKTIRLDGYPLTIVGVTPKEFTGEVVGDYQDMWVPMMLQPQVMPGRDYVHSQTSYWLTLIGRMKPGLTFAQTKSQLDVTFSRIANSGFASKYTKSEQDDLKKAKLEVYPGGKGISGFRKRMSEPLVLMMLVVGLVLLIACVNVANLMLARSASRQREIAVRLAIGATTSRIVRQVLTESVMLACLGGTLGLIVAQWGTKALPFMVPNRSGEVPLDTSPDPVVLTFTFLVCVLTGILFGLVPALRARRVQLTSALNSEMRSGSVSGGGASRWSAGRILVAAQVTLSVLVLFIAGLLMQTLRNLQQVDTGYERHNLVVMRIDPRVAGHKGSNYIAFCNDLLQRIRSLPGVTSATYSGNGLFSGSESDSGIVIAGQANLSEKDRQVFNDTVGPNYFSALNVPMLQGRDIGPQDIGEHPKVAVINEAMARKYFGEQNALGQVFHVDDDEHVDIPLQVVGVARDIRDHSLTDAIGPRFYTPVNLQDLPGEIKFEVRTTGNAESVVRDIRGVVKSVDPALKIPSINTLDGLIDDWMDSQIFVAQLSGFFAGLALVLACVGLYGISAYSVAMRTRELGVRMALGAKPRDVIGMVLKEGFLIVLVGAAVGVPAAIAGSHLLRSMLFEVTSYDPRALTVSLTVLVAVGFFASYLPARKASRVDPMVSLRYE